MIEITKASVSLFLVGLLSLSACNSKKDRFTDTFTTGVIQVAVDESFQPIVAEEIRVFENKYPLAGVEALNVSETDAFNLFLKDCVRVAIVTRPLSTEEIASFQSRKLYPKDMKIATDGIALIVNKMNPDTLITVEQIKSVLSGKIQTWQELEGEIGSSVRDTIKVVFDNSNSSTVRFMQDSVCGGNRLLAVNLFAQKNNPEVIDFVARTPNALGIIGVSWIGEKSDSTLISFIHNIRVMSVSNAQVATSENSYKPYQAYVALGKYPLRRSIYALLNDPRGALSSGFYTFLSSDQGQRILLKSGIVPATQPVRIVTTPE